jgi:uroporphyrinogen III methyltransferase/synthase
MKIKIGCRKSKLAQIQALEIIKMLKKIDNKLEFEIIGIETTGDKDKKTSIEKVEGTDFFTKEIDLALLNKEIDVAVHSAKDLPYKIYNELEVAAITKGVDNRDVIVLAENLKNKVCSNKIFQTLPLNIKIGTSSKRRKEQLKKLRPDIKIVDIRGTIEERLDLIDKGKIDGILIAAAGLLRLKLKERIFAFLPFITSPLQGRLAVVIRKENVFLKNLIEKIDDRKNWGKLFIVGCGPGDKELLTIKASKIINMADAILYDFLINNEIITKLSKAKIKICVGKRKGKHLYEHEEINFKMVKLVQNGLTVARLKGGDPAIFGNFVDEISYIKRNFVNYEIIPGVTAATVAACYAEIPITMKQKKSYVVFSTGYPIKNSFIPDKNFSGTLVYYMSGTTIKSIVKKLIDKGWDKNTLLTIISNVSNYNQKVYQLSFFEMMKRNIDFELPAITIINGIGRLGEKSWYELKPKVLFTGTTPEKYRDEGEIIWQQLIDFHPKKIKNINLIKYYDYIIFTSKHAVKYFFSNIFNNKNDSRFLNEIKILSIGKTTSDELKKYGIISDLQAKKESAEGLIELIKKNKIKRKKFLIPCSNLSDNFLVENLRKIGNSADKIIIYNNIPAKEVVKYDLNKIDKIIFTSPSTVKNFIKIYKKIPKHCQIITPGKTTMQEVIKCL